MSGGLTYVTFRPMGHHLADTLARNLDGEFDDELELNPDFAATLDVVVAPAGEAAPGAESRASEQGA